MALLHRRPTVDLSLRSIDVFDDCTVEELRVVAMNSLRLERPRGWVLFRELDIQREVVALVSGGAIVSLRGRPIGVMRGGTCAGGVLGMGRRRWSATGVTSVRSTVVVLSALEVAQIVKDVPRLGRRLLPVEGTIGDGRVDRHVAIDPVTLAA